MRKRLYLLSLLLLTVCGQMWASYSDGKPDRGTRCNGNSPTIEDSGDKLECFRTTDSYGAFSWNGGLKKVYIGPFN